MKPRDALVLALRDFYANSWRLVAVNAAFGAIVVASILAALALPIAGVLIVAAGPAAAIVVHCSVTLVRTGNLALADAWEGLRLHWRRGVVLSVLCGALLGLGAVALRFYGAAAIWPLAFLTLYLLALLGIYGLILWTLAIAEPECGLRRVAWDAGTFVASRPSATLVLGLVLLLVNLAGIAAAVMPFLTLTVAYTFLAIAHFVLPSPILDESS